MFNEGKEIVKSLEEKRELIEKKYYYPDDVLNSEDLIMLMDYINQLENLLSRETNRRKIATYDYARLDKKLDDIRAIVSKSLFKTDLVELCRMKNQIIDVLDKVGGSNE